MNDEDKFMGELGLILLIIILLILLLPILAGIFTAVIVGATGMAYYTIVIMIACIIWLMVGLVYWI